MEAGGSAFFPIDVEEEAEEERRRLERDRKTQRRTEAALKQQIERLERRLEDQEAGFAEASKRFQQKQLKAQTTKRELQSTLEQLEKRLEAQSKLLEEERAKFQTKQTIAKRALTQLSESFHALLPQFQGILDDDESVTEAPRDSSVREGEDSLITNELVLAQSVLDREQAQEAKDALATHQEVTLRYFAKREEMLTCPISLDLLVDPVTTSCCGKTFSAESLRQAFASNPVCPICRARVVTTTRCRDVAALVELHRSERTVVGAPGNGSAQETGAASGNAVIEQVPPATRQPNLQQNWRGNPRQSAQNEHRTARVVARSATTRRRRTSARATASTAVPNTTAGNISSRINHAVPTNEFIDFRISFLDFLRRETDQAATRLASATSSDARSGAPRRAD